MAPLIKQFAKSTLTSTSQEITMSAESLTNPNDLLIDHHCHGVVRDDLDQAEFEMYITESFWAPPPGVSHFDTPMGLAIRRWCSPLLDLERHASSARYLERRLELGAAEVNRRLMTATGITHLLLDTGFTSSTMLTREQMAEATNATAFEVTRIEAVAEEFASTGVGAREFVTSFTEILRKE